jgi:hypothetical protein
MALFNRRFARPIVALLTVLVSVGLGWAGLAWACVGVVSLTTSSSSVQPGGTLTVTGREFASGAPVVIHLDSVTGPVLATVPVPGMDTMTSQFKVAVSVPSDIQAGQHLLIAMQDAHDMNSGAPARSVFYVGTASSPPAAAPSPERPAALAVTSGRSGATLILIGLVAAGASLALVGLWRFMSVRAGRRVAA